MFPQLLPVLLAVLIAGAVSFYTFANEEQPWKLAKKPAANPIGSVALPRATKAPGLGKAPHDNKSETHGIAADEDLDESLVEAKEAGYTIWLATAVSGDFKGCDAGKNIAFQNGMYLTCSETDHEKKQPHPAVVIMKNGATSLYKVFIASDEYPGTLHGL